MNPLLIWREELAGLIPRGGLRRDRGGRLFVSDFPRHENPGQVSSHLLAAGFLTEIRGPLAALDATKEKYQSLLSALPALCPAPADAFLPLYALGRRLLRLGAPFSPAAIPALRTALKLIDARDLPGLYLSLAPAAAQAQREGAPLPAALGQMILCALWEGEASTEKGAFPC